MKNFITMSREQAKRYTYKNVSRDYIIISINDVTETSTKPPRFNRNSHLKDVLRLYFDDISEHIENYVLMSNDDAINIFNFIEKHDGINNIIIHCTAGVSISVSIKCALEECYNNRKIGVFSKNKCINKDMVGLDELLGKKDDDVYILNTWCYETIKTMYRFRELKNKYYDRPDLFIEKFLGINLLPFQKVMLKEKYKIIKSKK